MAKNPPPGPNLLERSRFNLQIVSGKFDFIDKFQWGFQKYGDVVLAKLGRNSFYLFRHPEQVKYILHDNVKNYPKMTGLFTPKAYQILKTRMGNGLITSEGEPWRAQKKRMSPHFLGAIVASYEKYVKYNLEATLHELRGKLALGQSFNIEPILRKIAFGVIGFIIFSEDLSHESHNMRDALDIFSHDLQRRFSSLMPPVWLPTPWNLKLKKGLRFLTETIKRFYEQRIRDNYFPPDVLTVIMNARDEQTGEPLSLEQISFEIATLILAGHETTASSLAWSIYLIATHPEWEERLLSEWSRQLQGRIPSFEDVKKLPDTKMVLLESMRLYPPVWSVVRTCLNPDKINGYDIETKSDIVLPLYHIHRHPDIWERPDEFDPERFGPAKFSSISDFAYLPFSHGSHACLGRELAMFQMSAAIPAVLQNFKIKIPAHARIQPECFVATRPKYGVEVEITAR